MRVQINAGGRMVEAECPDSGNSIREVMAEALAAWKATDGAQPPSDGPASYGFASERRERTMAPLNGNAREVKA